MVSTPLSAPELSQDSKERLRLWLRLLRASRTIEAELRERLKKEFDTTLPRFDVMAALYRAPEGMLMSDLSRFLLVSNGNVTGIVDRLVSEGLVLRARRNGDRRTSIVRLTRAGSDLFRTMATAHEGWISELLGEVSGNDTRRLTAMLKSFRSNWEGRE
jgi:DNA-binding MarR family transcriptional regulator